MRAPPLEKSPARLSASAGPVGEERGAETGVYSAHRRKATKLPDVQGKAKKEMVCY